MSANPVIVINNKEKKKPKFEGKKQQPKRGKLQGIPTEEQKWRIYDNYIRPQANIKAEMEGDSDLVKSIKEALGIPFKPSENLSNVDASPFEDPISRTKIKNELFDVETKHANDVIANENYQRQLKEDKDRETSATRIQKIARGKNIRDAYKQSKTSVNKLGKFVKNVAYLEPSGIADSPLYIAYSPVKADKLNTRLKQQDAVRRSERKKQYIVPQELPASVGRPRQRTSVAGDIIASSKAIERAKKNLQKKPLKNKSD